MSWVESRCIATATKIQSRSNWTELTYNPIDGKEIMSVAVTQGDRVIKISYYSLSKGQPNCADTQRRLLTTVIAALSSSYVVHSRAGIIYPICHQSVCADKRNNCYQGFPVGTTNPM